MALTSGSGVYTPPKPKPQVSYGAPSGPYAKPASTPYGFDPLAQSGQSIQAPQPKNYIPTKYGIITPPSYNPMAEWYKQQGSLVRGGRPADPTTMGHWDSAKFAAGLIASAPIIGGAPELALASKVPEALNLIRGAEAGNAVRSAVAPKPFAPAYDAIMAQHAAETAPAARPGSLMEALQTPPMSPQKRASMLEQAPSLGSILRAERGPTPRMFAPERAMKPAGQRIPGIHTRDNPMSERHFGYTGDAEPSTPQGMADLMAQQYGRGSEEHQWALEDMAMGEPDNRIIHNLRDDFGNTIGTTTYHDAGDIRFGHEMYLRPEYRTPGNIRKALQPFTETDKMIDAGFGNHDYARIVKRLHDKGKIRLTGRTLEEAKYKSSPGVYHGKNPDGRYAFETKPENLPPLLGPYNDVRGSTYADRGPFSYSPRGSQTGQSPAPALPMWKQMIGDRTPYQGGRIGTFLENTNPILSTLGTLGLGAGVGGAAYGMGYGRR